MADMLSECLIHEILSHLSLEEAAPVMILSKTWLQAWLANPNLKFILDSDRDVEKVDKIMGTYKDTNNPIEKFEFTIDGRNYTSGFEFGCIIDKWLDIALQKGVKVVACAYLSYYSRSVCTLPIFKILAANSLIKLTVNRFDLPTTHSLSSGGVNCHSLNNLSLSNVRLNHNMLQTLLTLCPLIVTLLLEHCTELKNIELRNLQKIKSISIRSIFDVHVIIQAPTLEHLSCIGGNYNQIHMVDIVECPNLKSLELSSVKISYELLEQVISTCQFLEFLKLCFHYGKWKKLLIKSQSLKTLEISDSIGKVVIDAPNLIEYRGGEEIPILLMPKESNQLKHSTISCVSNFYLGAAWFCKLKNFLSNLVSLSRVSIYFNNPRRVNLQELPQSNYTIRVDILDVVIMHSLQSCPLFVNALLWICHPRRLNVSSSIQINECFMECLARMKNSSRLKEVKAYKFDSQNQPVELTTESPQLEDGDREVYFLLDW